MSNLEQAHRAKFLDLIDRPLLRDDADLLVKLAKRLGIAIEWQNYELNDGRWRDGRYQIGDELPPPADEMNELIAVDWLEHRQLEFVS